MAEIPEEKVSENEVRQLLKAWNFEKRVHEHVEQTLVAYLEKKEILKQFERIVADYKKQTEQYELRKAERVEKEAAEVRAHKDKMTKLQAEAQAKAEEIKAINFEFQTAQSARDKILAERQEALNKVNNDIIKGEQRLEQIRREIDKKFAAIDALR